MWVCSHCRKQLNKIGYCESCMVQFTKDTAVWVADKGESSLKWQPNKVLMEKKLNASEPREVAGVTSKQPARQLAKMRAKQNGDSFTAPVRSDNWKPQQIWYDKASKSSDGLEAPDSSIKPVGFNVWQRSKIITQPKKQKKIEEPRVMGFTVRMIEGISEQVRKPEFSPYARGFTAEQHERLYLQSRFDEIDEIDDVQVVEYADEPEISSVQSNIIKFVSNKKMFRTAVAACVCVAIGLAAYPAYSMYMDVRHTGMQRRVSDLFDNAPTTQQDIPTVAATTPPTLSELNDFGGGNDADDSYHNWESGADRVRRNALEAEARGKQIYAEILSINSDFLGMLEIPGIIERQPYVLSSDNQEYFNTAFDGSRRAAGTLFMSTLNDRLMLDTNTIFMGHNMRNGTMFAGLQKYKDRETFEKNPVVILDGLLGESRWVIFAAHVAEPEIWWITHENGVPQEADMAEAWWLHPRETREEYAWLLNEIQERSMFKTDVDVTVNDRIISLVTCDYTYDLGFDHMRFIVHARKLRPGEAVPNSIRVTVNENMKQPSFDILGTAEG